MPEDRITLIKAVVVLIALMILGGSGLLTFLGGFGLLIAGGIGGSIGAVLTSVLKLWGIGLGLIAIPVGLWYALFRL